jgi:hypothetical protein
VKTTRLIARSLLFATAWWSSSCAPSDFLNQSTLNSVRVLVSSADQPFAQPGAVVNVQVLAYDGRPASERAGPPMNVDWIAGCKDPANDAYYACYPPRLNEIFAVDAGPESSVDAGITADGSAGCATFDGDAGIPAPVISQASFTMPPDAVTMHVPTPGQPPYGLALLFNIACAGDAGPLQISPNDINPQQIPFGCFDANGKQLGADDYVLGFARVYAYAADAGPDGGPVTNNNPVIDSVDVQGAANPLCFQGASPAYVTAPLSAKLCVPGGSCPSVTLGPVVPPTSQETNVLTGLREVVWVDYYSTFGSFGSITKLLYDPTAGSVGPLSKTDTDFHPPVVGPTDPRSGYIFLVVHDDRGGASWVTVPVQLVP